MSDPVELRQRMVEEQLRARDICDEAVLAAFLKIPRHRFIPSVSLEEAYADHPVPIGKGQTISQPYIVASMIQSLRLRPSDVVLEIGTGSGYQTALLSLLVRKVYSIEMLPDLIENARERLHALHIENVQLRVADGTLGWPEVAPFDAILVSAGTPEIPPPLVQQLAEGGRLILPLGNREQQLLALVEKSHGQIVETKLGGCVFVPLIGKHGWKN